MSEIDIRLARSDEAPAISALVLEVFEAIVAPYYGAEGRATFDHEAAPEAMAARLAAPLAEGRTALVAWATINGLTYRPMARRAAHAAPRHER